MRVPFRVVALVVACLLSGCGGGGGGSAVAPPPTPTPVLQTTQVKIAIAIPALIRSAVRSPRYVSPATAVVQIAVNGGSPQTFAVSNGTPCAAGTTSLSGTCTVYNVTAPVGTDTFAVTLLDNANHVLSQGTTTATIALDTANAVNVTFNGVVAALHLALANPQPPVGAPAQVPVTLLPVDAAGFTLIGAPGTLPSIVVADSDASGATGLYLAGSSGTCSTQQAPPSTTVTSTQSGATYLQVCLSYNGAALPNGATIRGTVSNGPSASTMFTPQAAPPAANGFWLMGYTSAGEALERVDANLTVLYAISGSQTRFGSVQPAAIAVDPAGNVAVMILQTSPITGDQAAIALYPGTGGGNVPPTSVTNVSAPSPEMVDVSGVALDGHGYAYFVGAYGGQVSPSNIPGSCHIYRVALGTNGAPTVAASCTNLAASPFSAGFLVGARGKLYLGVAGPTAPQSGSIFRFVVNSDGTATADSAITVSPEPSNFSVDANDNLILGAQPGIVLYAGSSFVPGQNTTVSPIDSYAVTLSGLAVASDAAGNIAFSGYESPTPPYTRNVTLIPAGSRAPTTHIPFSLMAIAPATVPAQGSGGALSPVPSTVELPSPANTITVSEAGYTGPINETNTCSGIATISPQTAFGPSATFSATPVNGGSCTVTFTDSGAAHTAMVHVGVTSTTVTGQGMHRKP